jgi:hypothetical protein
MSMDCYCFHSHEVDILRICGVVVLPSDHKQCEGTAVQNPNQKCIKTQTKNPVKSKTHIKKSMGNLNKKQRFA